jgi:hypothetical protein
MGYIEIALPFILGFASGYALCAAIHALRRRKAYRLGHPRELPDFLLRQPARKPRRSADRPSTHQRPT